HFRRTHEYRYLRVAGSGWRYLRSGQGKEVVLLLPGAPGICETSFQQILELERTCSVLSVIYPSSATTIARVTAGLQAILAAERINRVHILGTSYGGAIAQCLLVQFPQKIDKLVFICTGTPKRRTALKYQIYYCLLSLLPANWIHRFLLWRKPSLLAGLTIQRPFWNAYYDQVIPSLTKEDYQTRLRVWIDYHQNRSFSQKNVTRSPGQVLIIEAGKDSVFSLKEQQSLKALYPQARVYQSSQATHMAAISQIDDYFTTVLRFLHENLGEEL